jgi:guanosine-3',5'-bis(diphosphate) 3'-pyrophosphohydrolase
LPYEYHLQAVVDVLLKFGANLETDETAPLLVAAWLHDALEDTALDFQTVSDEFGAEVADIVWRVTDEPGRNRKERKQATYQKTKQSPAAIAVKLADRIANVAASKKGNAELFKMYAKEQEEFYKQLYQASDDKLVRSLWEHLKSYFEER